MNGDGNGDVFGNPVHVRECDVPSFYSKAGIRAVLFSMASTVA